MRKCAPLPAEKAYLGAHEEKGNEYVTYRMTIRHTVPWWENGRPFSRPSLAEPFPDDNSVNETLREYLKLKQKRA